jgi:hypothetical protein
MSQKDTENNDKLSNLNSLISLPQAAEVSGLSHSHLRLLIRRGDIWGKKLGRDWFTTSQAIKEYLAKNRHPGPKSKKV